MKQSLKKEGLFNKNEKHPSREKRYRMCESSLSC